MRVTFLTIALLAAAACSLERSSTPAPNPQRAALRLCGSAEDYPTNRRCESPMLIVDGKTVDFDSANLDPHDIASVEIVRGDSAVVRFGEQGRKGVVIVTSKKRIKD